MSKLQGKLPILLSLGFVVAILGLSGYRLRAWSGISLGLGAAQVLLYLAWLALEAKVAVGEIDQGETQRDKGTLEVYAAGRFLTVVVAIGAPLYPLSARLGLEPAWILQAVGLALFVGGVAFRLIAIRTLGRFYSHRVRQQDDHQIVNTGPYTLLRHPAYTGMLTAHLGLVLVFFNPYALGLLLGLFAPAVVWRILVEEKMLFEIPGYPEFAATHKRLIPFVWVKLALLGATGLVGSALCRAIRDRPEVSARALVRGGPERVAAAANLTPIAGSLEALPPELFAHEPQVVVHFATKQTGADFEATNVGGTRRLLEALPASVRVLLYGSSFSVYGQGPQRGEAEEDLAIRPTTALARSRAAAERAILVAGEARGFSAICLRPRFVLGQGDRHTLPALLRVTQRGRGLGSGEQAFSVIDVDDYAQAILAVAAHLLEAPPLQRGVHVAYARPLSLNAIQRALAAAYDLGPVARRLRLPLGAVNALAALPLGGLSAQAVKYQLVGQDHWVDVSALRSLGAGAIVDRDPREALEGAIAWLRSQPTQNPERGGGE